MPLKPVSRNASEAWYQAVVSSNVAEPTAANRADDKDTVYYRSRSGTSDWEVHKDDSGETFYFDTETKQSQWEEPDEFVQAGDDGQDQGEPREQQQVEHSSEEQYNKPADYGMPRSRDSLKKIISYIPADATTIDTRRAWLTLLRVVCTVLGAIALLASVPWWLVPVGWLAVGLAMFGLFSLLHDAGHHCFHKNLAVNDWVGTLCGIPILFPLYGWQYMHNYHHRHTNEINSVDIWCPTRLDEFSRFSKFRKMLVTFYQQFLAGGLGWCGHHAGMFVWPLVLFAPACLNIMLPTQAILSSRSCRKFRIHYAVTVLGSLMWMWTMHQCGGLLKMYVMPFIVFEQWTSVITYFHHRHPAIKWREPLEFDDFSRKIEGASHVDYPYWIEWLMLDTNWHPAHHLCPQIPWYNLRKCMEALWASPYAHLFPRNEFGPQLWLDVYRAGCGFVDVKDEKLLTKSSWGLYAKGAY